MPQIMKVSGVATRIITDGQGLTSVIYYDTPVVRFTDTLIRLNTGGWRTITTKTRMNQVSNQYNLGYRVFQKNFNWFVTYRGQTVAFVQHIMIDRVTGLMTATT